MMDSQHRCAPDFLTEKFATIRRCALRKHSGKDGAVGKFVLRTLNQFDCVGVMIMTGDRLQLHQRFALPVLPVIESAPMLKTLYDQAIFTFFRSA